MAMGQPLPGIFDTHEKRQAIARIAQSYQSLLGVPLVAPGDDVVDAMWHAPRAILAHGTEADPIFFFANRYALDAFGYDLETLLQTPSRLSAEAPLREERQALLDRVSAAGYIDDYAGIRVRADGTRFQIDGAVVWNIVDSMGARFGQAATFVL